MTYSKTFTLTSAQIFGKPEIEGIKDKTCKILCELGSEKKKLEMQIF